MREIVGICFVIPAAPENPIFGFAQFITAFSFLALVYTVSDVRYKFRIAAARLPIVGLTYLLSGFIGFGSLLVSVWFAMRWPLPVFVSSQVLWQSAFAALFFSLAMTWVWYAFVRPTRYGRRNAAAFANALFQHVMRGSNTDLPTIALELARSAPSIVRLADASRRRESSPRLRRWEKPAAYARDILMLIGNRKFCRHVVASAPNTAIAFFQTMTDLKKYDLPIGQFAANVSAEAIRNKDSNLYHENEGYYSGLLGYIKPVSKAL